MVFLFSYCSSYTIAWLVYWWVYVTMNDFFFSYICIHRYTGICRYEEEGLHVPTVGLQTP